MLDEATLLLEQLAQCMNLLARSDEITKPPGVTIEIP